MDEIRYYVCLGCLYLYAPCIFSFNNTRCWSERPAGRRKQHRTGVPQERSFGELGGAVSRVTRLFRMVVKQRARVPGWRRHYFPIPLLFLLSAFFLFLLFPSVFFHNPQKSPHKTTQCSLVKSPRTPLPSLGASLPLPGPTGRSLSSVPLVGPCL